MIKYLKNDEEVQEYVKPHKDYIKIIEDIICDTKREKPRPIVPKELQKYIFEQLHNVSHPSVKVPVASLLVDRYGVISIKTLIYGLNHALHVKGLK